MASVVQTSYAMTKMYNVMQHSPQLVQSKRPLAPAPTTNGNNVSSGGGDLRCKRKIQFGTYGGGTGGGVPASQQPQQPASVARRNARERNRVKQVNNGFATLRQHIPPSVAAAFAPQNPSTSGRGASKKLSKVETLRLAVEYIRSLKEMIEDHETVPHFGGTHHLQGGGGAHYAPMPCSEASQSPTPSHSSDGSFSTVSNYGNHHHQLYASQENYDNDDDEILDAIFSWQQNE